MKKQVIYRYLGTNGVIESPVHLEDTYYIQMIRLVADEDKILTDGYRKVSTITVSKDEEKKWKEIPNK